MIRPLTATFAAVLAAVLAWPLPALAQDNRLTPPAALGVDATFGTKPDGGWLAAGPRVTVAMSARSAIEAGFHRQIDRSGRRRRDLAFVQATRDVHRFNGGALFVSGGIVGVNHVASAPPSGGFPGFFTEEFNVGVIAGGGIRAEVAPRLSIRADAQVVLSDDAFLRASVGVGIPLGGRYPDHDGWREGRNPAAGSATEDLGLGQHLWVTTDDGLVVEGDAIRRTPVSLTLLRDGASREIPLTAIRQIETTDRLRNGAIWGALGGGIPGGIFGALLGYALCESDDNCGLQVGLAFGGMTAGFGALAGLVVDSLIDGRRPVR